MGNRVRYQHHPTNTSPLEAGVGWLDVFREMAGPNESNGHQVSFTVRCHRSRHHCLAGASSGAGSVPGRIAGAAGVTPGIIVPNPDPRELLTGPVERRSKYRVD